MQYLLSAKTDIGIKKITNQDSLSVKKLKTPIGTMVFAILCDGMGGLSKGELASATVVKAYEDWVRRILPGLCNAPLDDNLIEVQWESIMKTQNELLNNYGDQSNISLGTTATILLLTEYRYFIMNIGDTRAYMIDSNLKQITQDHSFVAREIQNGNLTEEQAKSDPRRNVLLQCIGASKQIFPDMYIGDTTPDTVYMLCTDGFRHKVSSVEIYNCLNPIAVYDANTIQNNSEYLIQLNKERQETDNISIITIRTCVDE